MKLSLRTPLGRMGGRRYIAPLILNVTTRRRWVVGATQQPLYSAGITPPPPSTHSIGGWVENIVGLGNVLSFFRKEQRFL